MSTRALQKAIDAAGGQSALADKLSTYTRTKVLQQNVWSWLNRTKRVPPTMAIPIEKVVEGAVTRHELRPDLYPKAA